MSFAIVCLLSMKRLYVCKMRQLPDYANTMIIGDKICVKVNFHTVLFFFVCVWGFRCLLPTKVILK